MDVELQVCCEWLSKRGKRVRISGREWRVDKEGRKGGGRLHLIFFLLFIPVFSRSCSKTVRLGISIRVVIVSTSLDEVKRCRQWFISFPTNINSLKSCLNFVLQLSSGNKSYSRWWVRLVFWSAACVGKSWDTYTDIWVVKVFCGVAVHSVL